MTNTTFTNIVNSKFQIQANSPEGSKLKQEYLSSGILVFENFINPEFLTQLQMEAEKLAPSMYKTQSQYNIYVKPNDDTFGPFHPRNRIFKTQKGCICDDQLDAYSFLKVIYNNKDFRNLIAYLVDAPELYPYEDALSSININYYNPGDNLEWHFDNADFTITLLIKKPDSGGIYQYFPNMRYDATGQEDYSLARDMIDSVITPVSVDPEPGSLMLFRGNNSLHRVTTIEDGQRILVTLNFNRKPGVSLSQTSRMTFFGRIN